LRERRVPLPKIENLCKFFLEAHDKHSKFNFVEATQFVMRKGKMRVKISRLFI